MLEALWSIEFVSSLGIRGAGVVVLETGRVFGGDAQYYYVGSFSVVSGVAEVEVTATHYAGTPWSVFGPSQSHTMRLRGAPARDTFDMHGEVVGRPGQQITLRLTRRAELP